MSCRNKFRFGVTDSILSCCGACQTSCNVFSDEEANAAPNCITVIIASIVEGACGLCNRLNKSYNLLQVEENGCVWECDTLTTCDPTKITLTAYEDGGDYKIKVELENHVWEKNYGTTKPTCTGIRGDTLTHQVSAGDCDSSSSTCVIADEEVAAEDCWCGDCWCDGELITPDGTVGWIAHDIAGSDITAVAYSAPCVTYYVDSVSGGGAETGSGTEEDPWTNLNSVFSDDCIYAICTSVYCPRVKVLIKGTIDYEVVGNIGRNYLRRLILEPWEGAAITIEISWSGAVGSKTIIGMRSCVGCIFKNINTDIGVNNTSGVNASAYGFYQCGSSTFDNCNSVVTSFVANPSIPTSVGAAQARGFYSCSNSIFEVCEATSTSTGNAQPTNIGLRPNTHGFVTCGGSSFRNCTGTATGTTTSYVFKCEASGFDLCGSSVFDGCNGSATAYADRYAISAAFWATGGLFNDCIGTADTTVDQSTPVDHWALAYGFYNCDGASFDNCTGNATASAVDDIDGGPECCGFYNNTAAVYFGCTESDNCAIPVCDIP